MPRRQCTIRSPTWSCATSSATYCPPWSAGSDRWEYPTAAVGFRSSELPRGVDMASFRELLKQTKSEIREISPADAEPRLGEATFLDVRELDEFQQGMIPGAVFIPRGHLESQVENKIPDRDAPVVVYCAGGIRSAFAAKTLQELGYTDVVSMAGGFSRWKNEGRNWVTPNTLSPEQRDRYGRHILLPEVGEEGQQKLLGAKVLLLGA